VVALVVVLVVVALLGARRTVGGVGRGPGLRSRPRRNDFRLEGVEAPEPLRRAAVVANPTKFTDVEAVRMRVANVMRTEGYGEPLWYETTVTDPGTGQARQALADGAVLVCALGGDGTMRAVAQGLVGTGIPMGLLPGGTGNLFARNLDVPVDSLERALLVALTGQNQRVDVGRLQVRREGSDTPEEHLFLAHDLLRRRGRRGRRRCRRSGTRCAGAWATCSSCRPPGSAGSPTSSPARAASSAAPSGCGCGWAARAH